MRSLGPAFSRHLARRRHLQRRLKDLKAAYGIGGSSQLRSLPVRILKLNRTGSTC